MKNVTVVFKNGDRKQFQGHVTYSEDFVFVSDRKRKVHIPKDSVLYWTTEEY
jgi:hypothetical protein